MLEQNSSIPEGDLGWDIVALTKKVYRAVNVSPIENYSKSNSNISQLLFYGELLSSNKPVLIIVKGFNLLLFFIFSLNFHFHFHSKQK